MERKKKEQQQQEEEEPEYCENTAKRHPHLTGVFG
jgi:hypothetical protein